MNGLNPPQPPPPPQQPGHHGGHHAGPISETFNVPDQLVGLIIGKSGEVGYFSAFQRLKIL